MNLKELCDELERDCETHGRIGCNVAVDPDDLLTIVAAARLAPTWISVEKRLPESARQVIAAVDRAGTRFTVEAWYGKGRWWMGCVPLDGVYAWQEMPMAPAKETL